MYLGKIWGQNIFAMVFAQAFFIFASIFAGPSHPYFCSQTFKMVMIILILTFHFSKMNSHSKKARLSSYELKNPRAISRETKELDKENGYVILMDIHAKSKGLVSDTL